MTAQWLERILRALATAGTWVTLLLPVVGAADGLTGLAEPTVNASRSVSTGAGIDEVNVDSLVFRQRYRLGVDRSILPLLRFSGTLNYDQLNAWQEQEAQPLVRAETRNGGLDLRLDMNSDVWNWSLAYNLRGRDQSTQVGNRARLDAPVRYGDILSALISWRPVDLPTVDLRYLHGRNWGGASEGAQTSDVTSLQVNYAGETFEARYRGAYARSENDETGVVDQGLTNGLRGSWGNSFVDRRLNLFASVDLGHTRRETQAVRADAVRETQQTIAAGLSAVERFPATPERITLDPNPSLTDGNVAGSAGLDIGYGRSDAGDIDPRDMGGRFVDAATPVTELRLWVDQRLPIEIWSAFTFAVYRSDDNITWAPVSPGGPVRFDENDNRFEIPIVRTAARYLKVVTRPLASGVTTDRVYAQILVTELQAFLVESLPVGSTVESTGRAGGTASARYIILRSWNLTLDSYVDAARQTDREFTQWLTTTGISFLRRVAEPVVLNGRAERSDAESGLGVETSHRVSLGATYEPLPTLGGTFGAGASRFDGPAGERTEVNSQLGVRADLYTGVSVSAQGDLSYGRAAGDVQTQRVGGTGNVSVTPHRTVTLAGSFLYSDSQRTAPGQEILRDQRARLDGSVSWTPVPSLNVAASVGRDFFWRDGTTAGLTVNASPLRDGALLLSFIYSETYDSIGESRSRNWGPSARYRIARRGYLDLAYTDTYTRAATGTTAAQVLYARLNLAFG